MQTEPKLEIVEIEYRGKGYQRVIDLRQAALRTPIGLVLQEEEKQQDEKDTILGGYVAGKLCCCLIIRFEDEDGLCRFRQIAVDENEQKKGYGTSIIKFSEDMARRKGMKKAYLKARVDAVPFYLKLGYLVVGERFIEVKLPHIRMEKNL